MINENRVLSSLSFEEALKELEVIVGKMEKGHLPLEEAISAYEVGSNLKKHCEDILRQAKLRVDKITVDIEGNVSLEPMNTE